METEAEKKGPPPESELLNDGTKVPVTFRDGTTGKVKVRKIPICDMDDFGRAFGRNVAEVACVTESDEAFAKTLNDESFVAVFEEGRRLNFPSFKKWWAWQEQTLEALGQSGGRDDLVNKVIDRMTQKQIDAAAQKSPSASA